MRRPLRLLILGTLTVFSISGLAPPVRAAAIVYLYNAKSELVGLVDQDGASVVWSFDANGNLVSISRTDASSIPGPVGISLVFPSSGNVGDTIEIFGKGLANPTSVTFFNGVAATVLASDTNYIRTSVPSGAATGLLHVVTPLGQADSPSAFTVFSSTPITISPTLVSIAPGGTQQFTASGPAVWLAGGIVGGSPEVGTISATGLYTSPSLAAGRPTPEIIVAAQSPGNPHNEAQALVYIVSPGPDFRGLASRAVTVAKGQPFAEDLAVPLLAVQREPAITAVNPPSVAQGAANIVLVLTGQGLGSPSALAFLLNGTNDTAITFTKLAANGPGTQATAILSVGGAAAIAARTVKLTAGGASSTSLGTGANLLQVVAAPTAWWDTAWHYRKPLSITAGADALAVDYSLKLVFDHAALVSVSKSLASGDDVRLTYWNGTTEVPLDRVLGQASAWNATSTTLWFKLPAALAARATNANYFLYYGNPAAGSPPANPDTVFQLYDDFGSGTLDAAKWVAVTSGAVSVAPTGGELKVSGPTDASNQADTFGIRSVATFTGNVAMESTFSILTQSATAWANWKAAFGLGLDNTGLGVNSTASTNKRVQYWNGTAWVDRGDSTLDTQTFSAQAIRQTLRLNGTAEHYESGVLKASRTGVSTAARSLVFQYGPDQPNETFDVRFDTIIVRKYVASDGSIALALGAEVAR